MKNSKHEILIPPFDGTLSGSQIVRSHIDAIQRSWNHIVNQGAFVFDVDETLVGSDASFEEYPELLKTLHLLIREKVEIAFISGSPTEVVKNRILIPLQRIAVSNESRLNQLTFYVNGGSTKIELNQDDEWIRDEDYAVAYRIPAKNLTLFRDWLQDRIYEKFNMDVDGFERMIQVWRQKREKQWGNLNVRFDDRWIEGKSWQLLFWPDRAMAAVKAGKGYDNISFPFINTRGVTYDSNGEFLGLSGFSASGFYEIKEADGVGFLLDVRDYLMERAVKDIPEVMKEISLRKAGRSSLDATKKGADKAAALRDFIHTKKRNRAYVFYFGDEFFAGGNDEPIANDERLRESGICLFSLNKDEQPCYEHVLWIGRSPKATHDFLSMMTKPIKK